MMKKHFDRKGFTLAEVLIVVAIIVVLAGVGFIALFAHMRAMHQVEMDGHAKEIFVAAQNHLTLADSQGYLGKTGGAFGTLSTADVDKPEEGENTDIFYFLVGSTGGADPDNKDSILNQMLPFGSVDESARTGGSYIIRYQKSSATVLDVFYVSTSGRYSLDEAEESNKELKYNEAMDLAGEDNKKARREEYKGGKTVLGWYGGAQAATLLKGEPLIAPGLQVLNGDKLEVIVTDNNVGAGAGQDGYKLNLIITGTSAQKVIDLSGEESTYTVTLDDVTSADGHFVSLGSDFVPGENIKVKAVAFNNELITNIAESSEVTTNSLFEDVQGTVAKIGYLRHLINLDIAISRLGVNITEAEQTADLSWTDFKTNVDQDAPSICPPSGGGSPSAEGYFLPVDISSLTYDGKGFIISDIEVSYSGDAGLFGTVNNCTVRDLELVDFVIETSGSTAGALAGSVTGTSTISGVLVHNSELGGGDSGKYIKVTEGTGAAGGLIGKIDGSNCKVESSAAAVYVSAASGPAGGLIGETANGPTVVRSYSGGHTQNAKYDKANINVISNSGSAGGLIGVAAGGSVNACYSTCSAASPHAAANTVGVGGLIGEAENVSINHCYSVGLVDATGSSATVRTFVALVSGTTAATEDCAFLSGVSESSAAVVTLESVTGETPSTTDSIFKLTGSAGASAAYDRVLTLTYKGEYPLPTADMLASKMTGGAEAGSAKTGITNIHYGDWQLPSLNPLNFMLLNNDTLDMVIELQENTTEITLAVQGKSSGIARIFNLTLEHTKDKVDWKITGVQESAGIKDTNGNVLEYKNASPVLTDFNISATSSRLTSYDASFNTEGKRKANMNDGTTATVYDVKLTLDDITQKGFHFAQLFSNGHEFKNGESEQAMDLWPGENIEVFVSAGSVAWSELSTIKYKSDLDSVNNKDEIDAINNYISNNSLPATYHHCVHCENSLFGNNGSNVNDTNIADQAGNVYPVATTPKTYINAQIFNIRHLQNLDYSTSLVNKEVTGASGQVFVTEATLRKSINWEDVSGDYATIWSCEMKDGSVSGSINGIYNPRLETLHGGNFTIENLVINSTADTYSATGSGNAGLFRYVDTDSEKNTTTFKIENLRLKQISVDGVTGNAGAFVGASESREIELHTVLADGDSTVEIAGGSNVGGLVGLSAGNLTITNSAASMLVTASGAAGGLVGQQSEGLLKVEQSYVGGHTTRGLYTWIDDSDGSLQGNWNIVSNGGPAGGLIGWLNEDASLEIEKAFNAATVKADTVGCAAGGLVGLVDGTTSDLVLAYVIAPVYDVKEIESYEYDEETGTYSPKYTTTGGTSGSLFGMTANDIETASDSVFFLPDVYNDPLPSEIELTEEDETIYKTNISYVGGDGTGGVSNVSLASYFVDEDSASSNLIGVDHVTLLEEMTSPFDPVLRGRYEFPFALWTKFSFESDSLILHFYGDWQPILNDNTVRLHVHFRPKITKIVDGVSEEVAPSSSTVDELAARETSIAVQIPYRPTEILLPYPASISEFGYHINDWALYYGDQTSGNLIVYDEDGMPPSVPASLSTFTLSSQQFKYAQDKGKDSNGDIHITIVANYSEDIDKHYKLQLWDWDKDVNPLGSVYTEHGSYMVMPAKDEDKQDILLKTMLESKHLPMLNMPDYRFRGWKDGGGTRVYTTAYDADNKKFVMTYTGDETVTVSETGDLDLYAWYEKVPQQAVDLEFYLKVDDDVDPVYYNSYTFSFDAEKGLSSSLPYPGSNLTYLSKQWLDETEGATEPATITNDGTSQLLRLTVAPSGELHNDPPAIRYRIVFRGQAAMDGYVVLYELEHTTTNEDGTYSYAPPTAVSTDIPDFGTSYYVAQFAGSKGQNIVPVGKSPRLSREDYPAEIGFVYSSTDVYDLSDVNTVLPDKYSGIYEGSFELSEDTDAPTYTVRYVVVVKYARARYELTYDSDGGTSYAPEKVEYDRPVYEDFLEGKTPVYGATEDEAAYTFLHWSMPGQTANIADAVPAVTMPNANLKVTAQKEGKPVKFTVVFWYENANDSGYAYAGKQVYNANVLSPAESGNSVKRAGDVVYSSYFRSVTNFEGYDQNTHGHFTYNSGVNEKVTLNGTGSSVVNVYFTRNLVTVTFGDRIKTTSRTTARDANPADDYVYYPGFGSNVYPLRHMGHYVEMMYAYSRTENDDTDNTYYALVNGEYLPLTRGEGTTTYRWKPAHTYTFVNGQYVWTDTSGSYYGVENGKYVPLSATSNTVKYFKRGQEVFEVSSVSHWYRPQVNTDNTNNCFGIRDNTVVPVELETEWILIFPISYWAFKDTGDRYNGTVYKSLSATETSGRSSAYEFYNGDMHNRTFDSVTTYSWITSGGSPYSSFKYYGNNNSANSFSGMPHFTRANYSGDYMDVGKIYLDGNGTVADMNAITTGITYYYATSTPQDTLHNNATYPVYAPLKTLESADVTTEYVWNYTVDGETVAYKGQRYARSASEWTGGVYSGTIYTKSGAEYTAVSGDPGTLNWDVDYYGVDVNGGHVRLRSVTDSAWIWYDQDGVGTVYTGTGSDFYKFTNDTRNTMSVTMVWRGKWKARFSNYNFDWTMIDKYSWKHTITDTFLYAFVMDEYDNPQVRDYKLTCQGPNGTNPIYHYRQELDGTYKDKPATAFHTSSDNVDFKFTSKFDEFTVSSYTSSPRNHAAEFSPLGGDNDVGENESHSVRLPLFVYHKRNSYNLRFVNNGREVVTLPVLYDRPLEQIGSSVPADSTLTSPGDGYEFKGWCLSSAMNSETIYFGEGVTYDSSDYITMNMPDGDRVLYAKWVQPDKTLTFSLGDGETMTAPENDGGGWTITVPYGTSVESVAGSQGWWKTDYQPRTDVKVADDNGVPVKQDFNGWVYLVKDADGNQVYNTDGTPKEAEYFISQGLTSDLTVYPHWKHENAPATSNVTVYYVKVGTADDQLESPAQTLKDAKIYQLNVGETIDEVAENVGEEWSITGSGWVSREAKNAQETVVFYYESTEWTYTVEYYVRLSSLPEKETWVPGAFEQVDYSPETPIITYGPGTANVPTAYGRFALVSISPIPGYSLDEVVYPDGNGVKSSKDALILLARGTNVVVKAYIVPDGETILEQNVWAHSFTGVNQGIDDLYNAPDGIDMHYLYYQEGVLMQSNGAPVKPLNAGVYGVRAYATRSVEVDGVTKTFLLWQSQDIDGLPGLTFYINRLDVLLTSNSVINVFDYNKNTKDYFDSDGRVKSEYASQFPEDAQLVTSVPNGVVRDTGVLADLPDGVTVNYAVTFAADSFRRAPSKTPNDYTPNVFSYKLTSGSANNYNFYLTYGRLYLWSDKAIYDQYMLQLSQEQQDQNEGG